MAAQSSDADGREPRCTGGDGDGQSNDAMAGVARAALRGYTRIANAVKPLKPASLIRKFTVAVSATIQNGGFEKSQSSQEY